MYQIQTNDIYMQDKSTGDMRKDSMFQTFSDASIIATLQPIQTKMKPTYTMQIKNGVH